MYGGGRKVKRTSPRCLYNCMQKLVNRVYLYNIIIYLRRETFLFFSYTRRIRHDFVAPIQYKIYNTNSKIETVRTTDACAHTVTREVYFTRSDELYYYYKILFNDFKLCHQPIGEYIIPQASAVIVWVFRRPSCPRNLKGNCKRR